MNDSEHRLADLEYWANEAVGNLFKFEAAMKELKLIIREMEQ